MVFSETAIWVAGLLLFAAIMLWPKGGLLARWRSSRARARRERLEDALKALHSLRQEGRLATPTSLAAALGIGRRATAQLIADLRRQHLAGDDEAGLGLTADGDRLALQVVRAHRLWERYLAGEARWPLARVHREAHRREHILSTGQIDELDALLGHPQVDPHGDPIPTREGEVAAVKTVPLTDWPLDRPAVVVHLEDEPPIAYAQLVAEGLHPGLGLRVLERSAKRITLSDGEREVHLAPAVAANVHLAPAREEGMSRAGLTTLADLPDRAQAEVVSIDDRLQGYTRRRLLDLGMTPGAQLSVEMRNFMGDPRAYRIRGTLIALRREQADQVWVRPVSST